MPGYLCAFTFAGISCFEVLAAGLYVVGFRLVSRIESDFLAVIERADNLPTTYKTKVFPHIDFVAQLFERVDNRIDLHMLSRGFEQFFVASERLLLGGFIVLGNIDRRQ